MTISQYFKPKTDDRPQIQLFNKLSIYITEIHLNSQIGIDPIVIPGPNSEYRISIVKDEIEEKLGYPHNDCNADRGEYYHQMNCVEQCINKEIAIKYNCSIPSYYTLQGLKECFFEHFYSYRLKI